VGAKQKQQKAKLQFISRLFLDVMSNCGMSKDVDFQNVYFLF